jgi:hypothetical protein
MWVRDGPRIAAYVAWQVQGDADNVQLYARGAEPAG